MNYLKLILAVCVLYAPVLAVDTRYYFRRPTVSGVTYIINENFEGTGKPDTWVNGSTAPNWDETTNAIDGQSVSFSSTTTSAYYPISDGPFYVAIVQFRMPSSLPGGTRTILAFREGTSTNHCSAAVNSSGILRIVTNGSDLGVTDVMSVDTNYYIKLIYNEGGSSSVEWSTTGVFAGSGSKYRSATSASSVTIDRFYIGYPTNSISGYRLDNLKFAAEDFSL